MPSVGRFLVLNTVLLSLGGLLHASYTYMPVLLPLLFHFQNVATPLYLSYRYNRHFPPPPFQTLVAMSCFNALSLFLSCWVFAATVTRGPVFEVLAFLPYSFMFEIMFDFFHYWIHRLLHSVPALYVLTHKRHHQHIRIHVYTSFEHNLLDLVLTNFFPGVLATVLLRPSTQFLCIWYAYKITQELFGHTGIPSRSSCFLQCMWLPRWLGIELYNVDHQLHHTNPAVNFGKRFSLWDKLFKTYIPGRS